MKKRNIFISFSLVILIALIFAGCSSSNNNSSSQNQTPADTSSNSSSNTAPSEVVEEEKVLTFWSWAGYVQQDDAPGQVVTKEFNEKYAGKIRVEARFIPASEYVTAIQAAIASNELPDIFQKHPSLPIRTAVDENLIIPIDDLVTEDYLSQFHGGAFTEGVTKIDGQTYTIPISGPQLMYMLYYNKDVMKNAGLDPEKPPVTWDELRSMSKTITEQSNGDVYGLILGSGSGGYTTRYVQGLAEGISPIEGKPFNFRTGEYNFDKQAWIDSVQFLVDLRNDGTIFPASYNLQSGEASVLLGSGQAAFKMDARWRMWQIKRDTPDANFGMSHIPTRDGSVPLYGRSNDEIGLVISSNSKHPEAAATFLMEGIGSVKFQEYMLSTGVALTPFPAVNDNEANYAYEEMTQWVKLHNEGLRVQPSPIIKNPEISKVFQEIGNMNQNKIKPSEDEILLSLIMGAETDIEGTLKTYNEKLNEGLRKGIETVKSEGVNVDISDFIFSDWNPNNDYTN